MPFGKSRMRVAVDSIVATRWCFRRSRRPQTWIRKRPHTSHIQILFPPLLKNTMKGSVACKATTGVQYLLQGALVPCLCGSSLHVAKFLVLVWYHDVLLQVYKMQHCYTCVCQEDRTEQGQVSAESSDPKAAASRVMKFMKASSWFVSLLFWGLATRAAAATQTDYASVREEVVQAYAQQAEEMGHALEVLQTVSGETSDAIRQIKNACGS